MGELPHTGRIYSPAILTAATHRSTLIDSTGGVLATWDVYAEEHGLDLVEVLKSKFWSVVWVDIWLEKVD
jgi:hypothetical protein